MVAVNNIVLHILHEITEEYLISKNSCTFVMQSQIVIHNTGKLPETFKNSALGSFVEKYCTLHPHEITAEYLISKNINTSVMQSQCSLQRQKN